MKKAATILAVDDQASFRFLLQQQLDEAGFNPVMASSVEDALSILGRQSIDLILSDLVMPQKDGMTFLIQLRQRNIDIPFVLLTAHASVTGAVEAMKHGAFDYVEKHCSPDELRITIQRALDFQCLNTENKAFKQELCQKYSFQTIVTASPSMKQVLELAESVVQFPQTTVMISGESGCGKEVLARAIHTAGSKMMTAFVCVNCAGIPDTLLESELFGHTRGAFTGADHEREGRFSQAKGGTILLDEIGDMPLALQAKLLRVLESREFEKVGSNQSIAVDCRVIAATNQNLAKLVAEKQFRKDLYHRINVFPIVIPPLRSRKDDIPILASHFLAAMRNHHGKSLPGISKSAMERLIGYDWPGNVRELRNCLERASILVTKGELIRSQHLSIAMPVSPDAPHSQGSGEWDYRFSFSRDEISLGAITDRVLEITLERCGGNKSQAAALLKVNRKMFYR